MMSNSFEILGFSHRMFFSLILLLFFSWKIKKILPIQRKWSRPKIAKDKIQVAFTEDNQTKSEVRKKAEGERDRYRMALTNVRKVWGLKPINQLKTHQSLWKSELILQNVSFVLVEYDRNSNFQAFLLSNYIIIFKYAALCF